MGLHRCVNSFHTRKLNNSAKTLQVVKPLLIEVYIVANANGTGLVRVHIYAPNFEEVDRAYWFRVVRPSVSTCVRPSVRQEPCMLGF